MDTPKVMVTGGAGFIGSALIRHLVEARGATVVNVDKLTYAGNLESLAAFENHPRYAFEQVDICDAPSVRFTLERHRPDAIVHLAAESHVDRSIDGPKAFVNTNILGTYTLLEEATRYRDSLADDRAGAFRFHHVSTDEVFGSLGDTGLFDEESAYRPNSPYSASKASADHLVRAWHHTYGLPVVTSNCANNYGPRQFPEKLVPLMILNALDGKPLPVYGTGANVRDWLYVDDHAEALWLVLSRGAVGETYNVGGHDERSNLQVVETLCAMLDEVCPDSRYRPHGDLITFVADRPGHDFRYAIDPTKVESTLGWRPRESFETGLRKTIRWYLDNRDWWQHVLDGTYRGERLGLGTSA